VVESPQAKVRFVVKYNSKDIYFVVGVIVVVNLTILVFYRRKLKKQ
jgi:hypothetical protein